MSKKNKSRKSQHRTKVFPRKSNTVIQRELKLSEMRATEEALDDYVTKRGNMVMMTTIRALFYLLSRDFGFGEARLKKLLDAYNAFWLKEERENKTVDDELWGWCKEMGLDEIL